MGILETVKKGFSLMVSSLGVVGIFFVYGAVTSVMNAQFASRAQGNPPNASNPLVAISVVLSLLSVFVGLYLQAGSMGYFKEKLQSGKASLGSFFASGARYFIPLLLFSLIIMGIVAVASVGSVAMIRVLPRPVAIVGSVVLIVVALIFVVFWFFAPYAIVVKKEKVISAIRHSTQLVTQNAIWKTVFYFLALLLMTATVLPMLVALLIYMFNEKARNNTFFSALITRLYIVSLILILIGFLAGFVLGLITGVGGAVVNRGSGGAVPPGAIAIMSIINAFLGVFMTATYMYFYLKVTHQEHATAA
jgi:small-conductance mechanosensitive channel